MKIARELTTEVLIIGGGGAGLRAALAAAEAGSQVLLTNKGPVAKSGITLTAAGGLQVPFHPDDSPEQFFQDTVAAGYDLGDQNLVRVLAEEAVSRALDIERYGGKILRRSDGNYAMRQLPGQSRPRNIFLAGGGIGLATALDKACRQQGNISMLDDFLVTGLLKAAAPDETAVAGAIGVNLGDGEIWQINARAVVMATGGCQWLWEVNDCPSDATGDGILHAYRAGAQLVDMEMVLFYPSVIVWPPSLAGAFVHYEFLSPAMLDGNVYDKDGKPVLAKPMPVRDEAMRQMAKAIGGGRGTDRGGLKWYVGDSPQPQEVVRKMLNTTQYNYIRAHGVEPATDQIEVAPGAHYLMGGISIDERCQTSLQGLFATPECAGNFDGANRLAGSGLTATQVFGAKAGLSAHQWAGANRQQKVDPTGLDGEIGRVAGRVAAGGQAGAPLRELRDQLRSAVQRYAGVHRDAVGLTKLNAVAGAVRTELAGVRVPSVPAFNQQLVDLLQLEVMCELAGLIAGSAMARQESRGHHFRTDFPHRDEANWLKHTLVTAGETGPHFSSKAVIRL